MAMRMPKKDYICNSDSLGVMKIFIHVNALTNGGAERVASIWASGLAARGHSVTVVIRDDGRPVDYYPGDGVEVYRIGGGCGNKALVLLRRMMRTRRLLRQRRPDVIVGVLNNATMEVYLSSLGLGIPVVNTEHNAFERPESAPMTRLLRFQKFFVNRLYRRVTVLTEADRRLLAGKVAAVDVLHNPLAFDPASGMCSKERVVLACGRLDVWYCKGFDLLIEAWGVVKSRGLADGWRLVIAGGGDGRDVETLKAFADKNGVGDSVELVGFQENVLDLYRRASVFVLSSRYEGFGMVLIEAMSQGCACIACDYNGRQQEIVGGDGNALCVPVDDLHALADAIGRLVGDSGLRETMGAAAIARSRDFMSSRIVRQFEDILVKATYKS